MTMENLTKLPKMPNLAQEIREGTLSLRGDDYARFCFSFSVEDYPIGIYAIRSLGPHAVTMLRRWDQSKVVTDPVSGLAHKNEGRQFGRVLPGKALFLIEFTSDRKALVSKAAFKAGRVKVYNADVPGMPEGYRFEAVELKELEILG